MKIIPVSDPSFAPYGKILGGYDTAQLDTARVKAFLVPAGAMVEVYATTLHYAPLLRQGGRGLQGPHHPAPGHQWPQAGDHAAEQ